MRRAKLGLTLLSLVPTAISCNSDGDQTNSTRDASRSNHPYGVSAVAVYVEEHMNDAPELAGDWIAQSLCEQAFWAAGGAGYYRVDSVVGVAEQPLVDGELMPVEAWTYVELTRHEDWSGTAPETVTLRIQGGPLGDGSYSGVAVRFSEGEELGLLVRAADSSQNAGFSSTEPIWVFRPADGALRGGGLEMEQAQLGAVLAATYAALSGVDRTPMPDCPTIPWDLCPAESLVPSAATLYWVPDACGDDSERPTPEDEAEPLPADREPDAG